MIPAPVLAALDRLNSHARAYGCGKDAIYAYKTLAALMLAEAGDLQTRPVAVMAKCNRCYGTGRWHNYGHDTGERCRTCGATGYVHLRFVETRVDAFTWHHPFEWHHPYDGDGRCIFIAARKLTDCGYRAADRSLVIVDRDGVESIIPFESPGDWTPNRSGSRLEGEAAAEQLNLVEDWIDTVHPDPSLMWRAESARSKLRDYALDIGRIGGTCHYCGSTEIACGQGHLPGLLHWSVPTCREHSRMPVADWDSTLPDAALTPQVERWLARRGWSRGQPLTRNGRAA